MKALGHTLFLTLICSFCFSQAMLIDSLSKEYYKTTDVEKRILLLSDIGNYYRLSNIDTALYLGRQALSLSKKHHFLKGEANALITIGAIYRISGDMENGMNYQFESLKIAQKNNFQNEIAKAYLNLGIIYSDLKDFDAAFKFLKLSLKMFKALNNKQNYLTSLANLGENHFRKNNLDSALYYLKLAHSQFIKIDKSPTIPFTYSRLGRVYLALKKYDSCYVYTKKALEIGKSEDNNRVICIGAEILSEYFKSQNQLDSAIYYAKIAFDLASTHNYKLDILESSNLLSDLYEKKDIHKAYYYAQFSKKLNNNLYGLSKVNSLQKKIIEEQEKIREKEANAIAYENKIKQYGLLGGICALGIIGFYLFRNNRQKQKANAVLENTLSKLKATQTQLIQSEKLASLGELTAGIAHEIQNPLNFVNNFSEVSSELLTEMNQELDKGDITEAKEISNDLKQNLEKITLHGKRASSIVKGMLEHSRTSTGEKELTDINALADEYLRLAYHGLRAKDKDFNADFKTDFDPNLSKIEVIPQDIGRVLLNLINNAFYAVKSVEKPMVIVSTQKSDNQVIISVKDNGSGISEEVLSKIFQPFFTTKPTGQGTGLGLSLAYDIVTKGHGGTIECESVEGVGTEFVVKLPLN